MGGAHNQFRMYTGLRVLPQQSLSLSCRLAHPVPSESVPTGEVIYGQHRLLEEGASGVISAGPRKQACTRATTVRIRPLVLSNSEWRTAMSSLGDCTALEVGAARRARSWRFLSRIDTRGMAMHSLRCIIISLCLSRLPAIRSRRFAGDWLISGIVMGETPRECGWQKPRLTWRLWT